MKVGRTLAIATVAGALAMGAAGCGGGGGTSTTTTGTPPVATTSEAPPPSTTTQAPPPETTAPTASTIELTMSGWSLSTTPEFQTLVDAFTAKNPNIKITIQEYDPNTYENLLLTDMTAGQAPDIITIKQAKYTWQWAKGGQLMDISDLVGALPANVTGAASYAVEGVNYGVPYRQDSWLLFYNADLFNQAGVAIPDGTWTWEDWVKAAEDVTAGLKAAGSAALGSYTHSWQSTVQGLANAQGGDLLNPNGPFFSGDYSYMLPYYQRVLQLQDGGSQVMQADITTNQLTYQAQFGKQNAAMMLMGSWYIATLLSQRASGDADTFNWGIAPAPQVDASTVDMPVTFGDPTGMGINAKIDPAKVEAAKAFLTFIASEEAATALAGIGITPSVSSDAVTAAVFSGDGMPTDDLSKKAYQVHKTLPENPSGAETMNIATILGNAHTAIMSESETPQAALEAAGTAVQNKDW